MHSHPPFNSDQFALCYRAYTAALLDIQYQNAGTKNAPIAGETCLMVALRIIEASAYGERDLLGLRRFAVSGLITRH
jgi:hypothetical protein